VWCSVMQCDAVWCSVLQCVAVCCSVLQCVAVCCSVLQCDMTDTYPVTGHGGRKRPSKCSVLQCVAMWCRVLQCGAVCHSVMQCGTVQCDAVCWSVLQRDMTHPYRVPGHEGGGSTSAVCCTVLYCDALRCSVVQSGAVNCSILQCVAACCNVMKCVAAWHDSYIFDYRTQRVQEAQQVQCVSVRCSVLQCDMTHSYRVTGHGGWKRLSKFCGNSSQRQLKTSPA